MASARIPLVPLTGMDEVTSEVFSKFSAEGRDPIALYRALANAPRVLRGYSVMASAIRYETSTDPALRELVILRVAQLTESAYEWSHHRSFAVKAGIDDDKVHDLHRWSESDRFSAQEQAVLRAVDEMHATRLGQSTFDALFDVFTREEAVELISISAFYEMVARIIQALDVAVEPAYAGYIGGMRGHQAKDEGEAQ